MTIKSSSYSDLAGVSTSAGTKKSPGKFFSVFITGEPRKDQEIGKLQCMSSFDDGEYVVHNVTGFTFIPYFIKRFWEKYIAANGKNGSYDKLVAFGWNDDIQKIDDSCKYAYVIAGVLLDANKKIVKHQKDIEASEIKAGDPVLIHFKCGGIKFNGAMAFNELLHSKAKELKPLGDSAALEQLIDIRRFICNVKIGIQPSDYGNKQVFEFGIDMPLPDKAVESVMDSAVTFKPDFEKQFDKTSLVKTSGATGSGTGSGGSSQKQNTDNMSFDDKKEEPAADVGEFDLGL